MPDVHELIRTELTQLVDRAPMPPSVSAITLGATTPVASAGRPVLRLVAAAAAIVVLGGGAAVVVATRDATDDRSGQVRATPTGSGFVETVDWPHYLATSLPGGGELQLVQEIRPGGLPAWTTQSWRVGDSGGSILLVMQAQPGETGEGPLDATDTVSGHPISWLDDQNSPNQATWSWPGAQVLVHVRGLTRAEATDALASLVPRAGGPAADGFDGPADGSMAITNEHFAADGQPAISRAWYGTDRRTDYEVQAVAPIPDLTPTVDLVSVGGDGGGERRTLAGRDTLVGRFGPWTTLAWFETDGTFVSVHARDVGDAELEALVTGIQRVDQPTWDAATAGLSGTIAGRPKPADGSVDIDGVQLSAHGGMEASVTRGEVGPDLCLTVAGATGRCAANAGRRDGGPYVVGPAGLLSWTSHEVSSSVADFVVDGEWWVAGRLSRSQEPVIETGSGPVAVEVVESGGATWFLARMPDDVDRYLLTYGGSVTGGWRPSGG